MPVTRVACLVENLIDQHTYDVENTLNPTTEQNIEVTHEEAEYLIKNFNDDVPLLWNHGLDQLSTKPIGKITKVYKKDNGLFCLCEHNDDLISDIIKFGCINNISMNHSRQNGIPNYKILEVSVCHTGLRQNTGIILDSNNLEQVVCSKEMEDNKDNDDTRDDLDTDDNHSSNEKLDVEGYKKFQDSVEKWENDGIKPDDWTESDGNILEYQMNRYSTNNFLDSQSSSFMIKRLGNMIIKEKERENTNSNDRTQFVSLLNSIAKNHLSSNGVKITPQQVEEARKRLIEESPLSVHLPPEQLNQLCEVRASLEASVLDKENQDKKQNTMDSIVEKVDGLPTTYRSTTTSPVLDSLPVVNKQIAIPLVTEAIPISYKMDIDDDKEIRLKRLELEIENKKIEQLLIQDKLNKRKLKNDTIKENQKLETLGLMRQKIEQQSRYNLPETSHVDESTQSNSKRQMSQVPASYDLSKWGLNIAEVSKWRSGMPEWGKPKPSVTKVRTLREFGMQAGVGNVHEKLSVNNQANLKPGNRDVLCSKEYEDHMKRKGLDHPLNRCLDLSVLLLADDNTKNHMNSDFAGIRRIDKRYNDAILNAYNHFNPRGYF